MPVAAPGPGVPGGRADTADNRHAAGRPDHVDQLGAGVLAVRNLLTGRSDRQGAARLFWMVFAAVLGAFLLRATWSTPTISKQIVLGVAVAMVWAGQMWLGYVAIEPFARRFWPQALISWTRLLNGRLSDPLVGRDILAGMVAGLILVLHHYLMYLAPEWFGEPAPWPLLGTGGLISVTGRFQVGGWLLSVPGMIENGAFDTFLVFLIFLLVLRRQWLAAVAFVVLEPLFWGFATSSPVSGLMTIPIWCLLVFVLVRFGLLAVCIAWAPDVLLIGACPLTPDLGAWYAGFGLWTLTLIAALASWSAYTAAGGRRLLQEGLFRE
jgi:hypothetical protein